MYNEKEYKKQWREENKERIKEYKRKYYQENKEEIKKYNEANKERRKVYIKKYNKEYRKTEKGKAVMVNNIHKRRAKMKDTDITTDFLIELEESLNNICPYCDRHTPTFHLDHMTPLSRDGEHIKENVMYCCPDCNLRKNAKTLEEFLDWRMFINNCSKRNKED